MGYFDHFEEGGGRKNPDDMKKFDPRFKFPAAVPYEDETHGGNSMTKIFI